VPSPTSSANNQLPSIQQAQVSRFPFSRAGWWGMSPALD
jgi:hypothetical protein